MCLGDLISKLWKAWRFPPIDILVILTYTLAGMSNIWKSCLLIATYYPSLYPFLFLHFLLLFLHLKLRIACPNTSELDWVLGSRNEKVCVGLTEEEIWDYTVTPTPCSLCSFICILCINTGWWQQKRNFDYFNQYLNFWRRDFGPHRT